MRLPLTGLLGCGLLRVFQAACRLSPISCVCSFAVPLFFLYLFLCRFSVCISFPCMCPYCFLPVPLVLLAFILCPTPGCRAYRDPGVERAETRVSNVPRPGCRTCRDPGVEHVKTRVSYNALPYLRIFFQPSVVSFPRACAYIIMCPFCLAFHPP